MPTNTQPQHRDKPIVYALDPLQPSAQALAEKHFRLRIRANADDNEWQSHAEGILVRGSYVTARDLEGATRLRFIAKHGVGVDKIDVPVAKRLGIRVMNTPGVNAVAVAELALALTMSVARKIPTIDRKIRSGEEGITKAIGLDGLTLQGRTIGILGGGNIGLAVGQMFNRCFGSSVLLYDPYITPTAKALWTSSIPSEKISFVDNLERELYPRADIISLHIPLLPSTRGLIGARQLGMMKPTAILVNTSRGGIVDETDLLHALRAGTIYGAGLDAFEVEPPTLEVYSGFAECDNVVMTPHIGAGNADTQVACNLAMVQHLVDALVHDTPRDCVC